MSDHLRLTREELYSLVWAKPMTEVGQDFQISDRAMAKICARKQVPVPPRGYWAKKNAGKTVPKPPLPEFVVKPPKGSESQSHAGTTDAREAKSPQRVRRTKPDDQESAQRISQASFGSDRLHRAHRGMELRIQFWS